MNLGVDYFFLNTSTSGTSVTTYILFRENLFTAGELYLTASYIYNGGTDPGDVLASAVTLTAGECEMPYLVMGNNKYYIYLFILKKKKLLIILL